MEQLHLGTNLLGIEDSSIIICLKSNASHLKPARNGHCGDLFSKKEALNSVQYSPENGSKTNHQGFYEDHCRSVGGLSFICHSK